MGPSPAALSPQNIFAFAFTTSWACGSCSRDTLLNLVADSAELFPALVHMMRVKRGEKRSLEDEGFHHPLNLVLSLPHSHLWNKRQPSCPCGFSIPFFASPRAGKYPFDFPIHTRISLSVIKGREQGMDQAHSLMHNKLHFKSLFRSTRPRWVQTGSAHRSTDAVNNFRKMFYDSFRLTIQHHLGTVS